ncbi:hypothetical protein DF153_33030 [Burkholderia cenocepacia]|nr:hypothetical protein CFB81_28425 [Burkholderia sp. AU28863]RQU05724.1 hypothetical protein DF152_34080 [Burkholderia cenocepacia]RQU12622.1 hypothetical protein DF153_33030 [Burkholderia cenocepacia]
MRRWCCRGPTAPFYTVRLNIYASNNSKSATINSICGIAQRQRTGIRLRPLIHEAINNKESA